MTVIKIILFITWSELEGQRRKREIQRAIKLCNAYRPSSSFILKKWSIFSLFVFNKSYPFLWVFFGSTSI